MVFSEVVAYFMMLATGATLFVAGKTNITSATDAAQALRPIAGDAAALLLAVGLIGAGVLAIPVVTGDQLAGHQPDHGACAERRPERLDRRTVADPADAHPE